MHDMHDDHFHACCNQQFHENYKMYDRSKEISMHLAGVQMLADSLTSDINNKISSNCKMTSGIIKY